MTQSTDFIEQLAALAEHTSPYRHSDTNGLWKAEREFQEALAKNWPAILALGRERDALLAKYNELLFAVAQKFPDETRHETALRYINEREAGQSEPGQALEGDNQ